MFGFLKKKKNVAPLTSEFEVVGVPLRPNGFSLGKAEIVSSPPPPLPPPTREEKRETKKLAESRRYYDDTMKEMGFKKPGHNIPHYTDPRRAMKDYVSGAVFWVQQTIFSLPTHVENEKARKAYIDRGGSADRFIPPYKEGRPVYSGFTPPEGVVGLARAWFHKEIIKEDGYNMGQDNEMGAYVYNPEQFAPETAQQAQEGLSLTNKPNRISEVRINGYIGYPTERHRVIIGMTIGGAEQIIARDRGLLSFFFKGKTLG